MILDLNNPAHQPLIYSYRKCKGIALVNQYLPNLSPLKKMYVIDSLDDWLTVEQEFPLEMMTARCDSPKGVNGKLPSGQTFDRSRVKGYIEEVKSAVPDAVILLEDMKEGSNERIHTKGGLNLDIQIGNYLLIDYVGPSFDCRELCTGKALHEAWNVPWDDVPFLKSTSMRKYKSYEVTQTEYVETAKERLLFLIHAFPERKDEILQTMPNEYTPISPQIMRDLLNQVVFPLWMQQEQLLRNGLGKFGVEINIVKEGTLVPFEIAVPERFYERNLEER